ncbi:hypothetical protein FV222_01535 [Methylobacterium sp. WL103]|uniref:hypothetical protein n=1 Tax=Methylobacterium sp. WL103 TaxID=2603891 RepID=UPI0011C9B3B5|nr:hypothetical protein [Methylobacterium sp. WL103]TXN07945.1 hypothetical protein FV222_01535 [Methylobacterium sp. WL103]
MNRDVLVLREVVVKLTQLLAGQKLLVTQRGTRAYVATNPKTMKPERVNIPHIPDNTSPELILAIQGFIDHEVGHVLHTDWKWTKKAHERGDRFHSYWNIFEDTFIERKQMETFKGAGWNLAKLHEFFIAEISLPAFKTAEDKGDAATMFGVMIVPIARAWSGQKIFQEWLDKIDIWNHPQLKAKIDRIRPIQGKIVKIASSEDSYNLAEEISNLLKAQKKPEKPTPAPEPEEDEEEGDPNGGKGKTPEDEGEGPAEKPSAPQAKHKPEPKDDEPAGDDEDEGDDEAGTENNDDEGEDGKFEKGKGGKDPLTAIERRVLTARIDRGKDFADIAKRMKKPADEIEQVYDRAMTKLKTGFGEAA